MFTIITALVEEHERFRAWFEEIEQALLRLPGLEEVGRLAREVDARLRRHAAAEEDLVLLVLDHLPEQKRRCDRFYTDHQEIDARLVQACQAEDPASARDLLRAGLAASRRHFKHEERVVFPLIEEVTGSEQLQRLGAIWAHRHPRAAST